jgi:serine acetyltransferase
MLLISLAHADFVASERGYLLREDVLCWTSWYQEHPFFKNARIEVDNDNQDSLTLKLDKLFRTFPEFRSLFDYRVSGNAALLNHKTDTHRRATELHINCPQIGPRFRIQHGQNTYVLAREIGADFWVNHNVTIGANGGIPVIGDRVTIRTGAVVVGPITISDDVIVTANAVVACDVPRAHVAYAPKTIFLPRRGYDGP